MRSKYSLIVGGSGQLGKHVVDVFKNKGWNVLNVDFREHSSANANVILDPNLKTYQQLDKIYNGT